MKSFVIATITVIAAPSLVHRYHKLLEISGSSMQGPGTDVFVQYRITYSFWEALQYFVFVCMAIEEAAGASLDEVDAIPECGVCQQA